MSSSRACRWLLVAVLALSACEGSRPPGAEQPGPGPGPGPGGDPEPACVSDSCTTPPASACVDSGTLRSWTSPGSCVEDACAYVAAEAACLHGCAAGACLPDPCLAVDCTQPPPVTCSPVGKVRTFAPGGSCQAGMCSHAFTDTSCPANERCAQDACRWDDARLSGLTVSVGQLPFDRERTRYTVLVPAGTTVVQLTPTVSEPTRVQLEVAGAPVSSGVAVPVALGGTRTPVEIRVQAESGSVRLYEVQLVLELPVSQSALLKTSTATPDAQLGFGEVALSSDGNTLAVGAPMEGGTGPTRFGPGAAYVYTRVDGLWSQPVRLAPPGLGTTDMFGAALSLSADGNTLAVGARGDSSAPPDENGSASGAVHVFTRGPSGWGQAAYLKASNQGMADNFGHSVSLSADGQTLAVGAWDEDGGVGGINPQHPDDSASRSGAAYVFSRISGTWMQTAYVKAAQPVAGAWFGTAVALSGDGLTLAVGALRLGRVYVFRRPLGVWTQQEELVPSLSEPSDQLGTRVSLSHDGKTLAVSAPYEAGNGGAESNNAFLASGAVYVFARSATGWSQAAYLKASTPGSGDRFGSSVQLAPAGDVLVVGAPLEDSDSAGVNGDATRDVLADSGAAYVFAQESGVWVQRAYVKSENPDIEHRFGWAVGVSASGTFAVSAPGESSGLPDSSGPAVRSGAVYVFGGLRVASP